MNKYSYEKILLLLLFGSAYLLKLYSLNKKYKIRANVLANKNKSEKIQLVERILQMATFIWGIVWVGEIISMQLNLNNRLKLWNSYIISISGLFLIIVGVTFFIMAAITMKNSWRVGIDKSTKSKLILERKIEINMEGEV